MWLSIIVCYFYSRIFIIWYFALESTHNPPPPEPPHNELQCHVIIYDGHTTGPWFKTRLVRYFLLSFRLLTTITASSWAFDVVCERSGRDFPVGSHQDIKIGSCVFQCDVPHQWCNTATGQPCVCILWRGGVSCLVSAAWHFCVAAHWSKYHCYKQAPSWYDLRFLKATLNPNKQTFMMDLRTM